MFEDFVENMWFPNQMNTNEHRKVQNIFIAFDR